MVSVERSGLSVGVDRTTAGSSTSLSVYTEKGYLDVGGGLDWTNREGLARSGSLSVGGTTSSLGVSGSLRGALAPDLGVKLGGYASVSADRTVADLGAYDGDNPALKDKRFVQVKRSLGGSGSLSPGAACAVVGVGGRLAVDRSKDVVYRTHVENDDARALLFAEKGLVRWANDKARALGLKEEKVVIPSLEDPKTLKVGDEMVVSTSGSVIAGLAVGGLGAQVGMQGLVQGDFDLAVKKTGENTVQLAVTPTSVRGLEVFLGAPIVLDVSHGTTWGKALRQVFDFDLSKPEAMAAYQAALRGELPSGLQEPSEIKASDEKALLRVAERERLPAGVSRTYLEKVEVRSTSTGFGLNWGPLQSDFGLAGLSWRRVATEETHVGVAGDMALRTETRGIEKRREVLLSGTESMGVFASLERLSMHNEGRETERTFLGLSLTARFTDSRVRGLELNDEVLDRINGAMGTAIKPFERKGHNQSRQVNVGLHLKPADVQALAAVTALDAARAARASGCDEKALKTYVGDLARVRSANRRAELTQDFIAGQGLEGMGALHRLLGGEAKRLEVTTDSNAYAKPRNESDRLSLKYPTAIPGDAATEVVKDRFKEVLKELKAVDEAEADLKDDPVLGDRDREDLLKQVAGARAALEAVVSVSHLKSAERLRLHRDLDAGWTTGLEYKLMAHLERAGLA
jgi:hypothetical protein